MAPAGLKPLVFSQLIVVPQQGSTTKVNAILFPFSSQVSLSLPNIRYLMHRGLDKATFYAVENTQTNTDSNAMAHNLRLKDDVTSSNASNPCYTGPTLDFGHKLFLDNYGQSLPYTVEIEHILTLQHAKDDPINPKRIVVDLKYNATWCEDSTGSSYNEYTCKISTFAKVFYLKDAANSFTIKSVLAKGSPEYSDYHETEWLAYAKCTHLIAFLNELKFYNK